MRFQHRFFKHFSSASIPPSANIQLSSRYKPLHLGDAIYVFLVALPQRVSAGGLLVGVLDTAVIDGRQALHQRILDKVQFL